MYIPIKNMKVICYERRSNTALDSQRLHSRSMMLSLTIELKLRALNSNPTVRAQRTALLLREVKKAFDR